MELGNISTHEYYELNLRPDVDVSKLTSALQRVIDRREMLRAVVQADGLLQVLHTVPKFAIQQLHISA
jgi:hypothetical protein